MSSAWIIFLHWTTASYCLQVPIAVRNDSLGIHFYLFWLARKNAPLAQWSWQMLKMGKFRLLNSLNKVLNLILSYNPFLTFQSCRTPSNCNYTFLYLSIMGTPYYMLIYNRLRLSETLHYGIHCSSTLVALHLQVKERHTGLDIYSWVRSGKSGKEHSSLGIYNNRWVPKWYRYNP